MYKRVHKVASMDQQTIRLPQHTSTNANTLLISLWSESLPPFVLSLWPLLPLPCRVLPSLMVVLASPPPPLLKRRPKGMLFFSLLHAFVVLKLKFQWCCNRCRQGGIAQCSPRVCVFFAILCAPSIINSPVSGEKNGYGCNASNSCWKYCPAGGWCWTMPGVRCFEDSDCGGNPPCSSVCQPE